MYDYYLDQNAGLYGLNHGSEPLHIFFDHTKNQVMIANNTFKNQNDLMIQVNAFDIAGKKTLIYQEIVSITPTTSKRYGSIGRRLTELQKEQGVFLQMNLFDSNQKMISENIYWLPNEKGEFSGLQEMNNTQLNVTAMQLNQNTIEVKIINPSKDNPVSFFNRISVIDQKTELRALPVFYSDNYISIFPGEEKTITIDEGALQKSSDLKIRIQGWNTDTFDIEIGNN